MSALDGRAPSRVPVPTAKFAVPRPLDRGVRRDRLLGVLDAATVDQVLLLSAPAGHGKTSLVAEWCNRTPERTAWVSLDRADRSETALWATILASLGACAAVSADSPVRLLDPPGDAAAVLAFAERLTGGLARLQAPVRLVLDDLHVLAGSEAMNVVESLLSYLPNGLQIILATRSDPRLPLARWRASGRLVEVRSDRLAFTKAEARDLVERSGLRLRDDQLTTLVEQTGGWAAGLRLATMSLASTDDPDGFLTDLAGNDRAIADYLVSEVLSRLPTEAGSLLRRLSICDQLSASLAEALTGTSEAVELLTALERESSLVVSHGSGRQWFRIHPLLRAHLKADLHRCDPRLKEQLYAVAARWYAADGDPAAGLRCAAHVSDPAVSSAIVHEHALTLLGEGQFDVLRDAWRRYPTEALDTEPTVALVLALAFLDAGEATIAAELAKRADRRLARRTDDDERVAATHRWLRALVRVRLTWLSGELDHVPMPEPDTQDLPLDLNLPSELALSRLTTALASAAGGDLDEARRHATSSLRAAELGDQPYVAAQATVILAVVAVARGELQEAGALAARADASAPESQWSGTAEQSVTSGIRCYSALMAGDPVQAISLAAPSIRFHAGELAAQQPTAALATMVVAVARHDLGDHDDSALAALREIRARIPSDPLSRKVLAVGSLWEQEISLALGQAERAREVLQAMRSTLGSTGDVAYLRACAAIARGRHDAGRELLDSIIDGRHAPLAEWVEVACRVQLASLGLRLRRRAEARVLLREALELAAGQGARRPLIIAPEPVIELLAGDSQLLGSEHAELIRTVLGLRPAERQRGGLPLTPRELEVLTMLPNLCSVSDIAADLSVSVNTVKTHLKAIYAKLSVDSRRKAIEVGRRHGYLVP